MGVNLRLVASAKSEASYIHKTLRALGKGLSMAHERGISRRDFLKLSGAGLTGAALLGVAGCGGGETIQGGGGGGGSTQGFHLGPGSDPSTLVPLQLSGS